MRKAVYRSGKCPNTAYKGMVTEVTLSPDGKMQNIKVIRSKFSPETEKCVLDILKKYQYPAFQGESVTLKYNVVM